MATPVSTTRSWHFGVFEVDTRRVELRRSGLPIKLREQSFLILVYLLENAGELVSRDELYRLLWPPDTFVDFDHSLNMAIANLRDALGDSFDAPLYIETVPRRGYRFIAPVSQVENDPENHAALHGDSASPLVSGKSALQEPAHRLFTRHWVMPAFVILSILLAAGAAVFLRAHPGLFRWNDRNENSANRQIVPLTTAVGNAVFPAISPNGTQFVYLWDGPDRRRYNFYLQLVGSDTALQITNIQSGMFGAPVWSPDGREIAFSLCDGKNDGVYVVPSLGGALRKLASVACQYLMPGSLAWLPDGKQMLMIDRCTPTMFGVVLFSLATGKERCLTNTGITTSHNAFQFSLSPDATTIAFTASLNISCFGDIFSIPLSGGQPNQLTSERRCFGDLMWTPDSQSIVFVSQRTPLRSLWRVPASGGPILPETAYPGIGTFSKDGRRFVFAETTRGEGPEIWRADLANPGGKVLTNRKVVSSQYPDLDAQPSSDNSMIAWMSRRTGFAEIWKGTASGESPMELTHLDFYSGTPRWSPDGNWIAFDSYGKDSQQILVIDEDGRNLHAVTSGASNNIVPSWSRDGKSIYFASNRTGSWQLWKHSLSDGSEVQVTKNGGFDAFESYNGQTIYFSKYDQPGIWSLPTRGGTESVVIPDKPQVFYWGHWAVTQTGLYLLDADAEPRPQIDFYNFTTRRIAPVLTFDKKAAWLQPSLSATADGRALYYSQFDHQSVVKMMEFPR